jgi:hypothetical protein
VYSVLKNLVDIGAELKSVRILGLFRQIVDIFEFVLQFALIVDFNLTGRHFIDKHGYSSFCY